MKNAQEFFEMYDSYCYFTNPANGFSLMTQKEYDYYCQELDYEAEHEMEIESESAWLRHAENQVDHGFEEWEHSRLYS